MRILAVVLLAAGVGLGAQQRPTFRAGVDTVEVYATVKHRDGRLVPNLTREDFEILSDGKPVAITVFSNEPKTITVAMLLDVSGSMISRFLWVRQAGLHFVDALAVDDRARIGSFGAEVSLSPHLTGDKNVLKRLLRDELWPGGSTPMWDALHAAMTSLATEPGRRVVLVVSDGDTVGRHSGVLAARIRERAIDDRFMVYAVGIDNKGLSVSLTALADETGGGFVTLRGEDSVQASMAQIADELRHQYLIGFSPPVHDGRTHRLRVRVKGDGRTARSATSYRAPSR